jgi:oxygen-independent coproporphyrinogen-3 oxidase
MIEHLYIHVPFCRAICTYCDFAKLVGDPALQSRYLTALKQEIAHAAPKLSGLKTIYIGGGTPSMLAIDQLEGLLAALDPLRASGSIAEYTIEANPNDVTDRFAKTIAAHGVNRVSLGIQSGNDAMLKKLNRTHLAIDAVRAVANLRNAGIASVSGDFIYALPSQTLADLKEDLSFALTLNLDHLSYYSLILEDKTLLKLQVAKKQAILPDADLEADMAVLVRENLEQAGYEAYETSNYAKPGRRSVHNLAYWQLKEYLGLGMAAHSQVGTRRFKNHGRITDYLDAIGRTGSGYASDEDADLKTEAVFLGLRVKEGVSLQTYRERFGIDLFDVHPGIRKHLFDGLLELSNGCLRTTARGALLLNVVERDLS